MKFTEEKLSNAVVKLGYKHLTGGHIHKEMADMQNCKKELPAFTNACL